MKQRIVIKLGGSSLQNPSTLKELAALVQGYQKKHYDVILVHGGGPAINQKLTERGIEWKFIDGQRQTTLEMIDVIEEVLAKDVNSMVVESLKDVGVKATGLSGAKDRILFCTQSNPELMQVGKVEFVDVTAIESSLLMNSVPVIAPIGIGEKNEKYNINADWAATQVAVALKAKKLIFLTDQEGILNQEKRLIQRITPEIITQMIEQGVISGGMCAKVNSMTTALKSGVQHVQVLHAKNASQLLNKDKTGTVLTELKNFIPRTRKTSNKRDMVHGRAS